MVQLLTSSGNWYNGVYNHVHILSSKATTELKDFPMPKGTLCAPNDCFCTHYVMDVFHIIASDSL